ncbi:MAG TPA: SDR family oxidoreductase [Candidatus Acidoferrales bacterium]
MRVFITGATGFIGSAIIPELINAGHQVLGLTRSDAGAEALVAAGAKPHRGALEDLESLRAGAAKSDGVIHCAFIHDFRDLATFQKNAEVDRRAIEALGSALANSNRPLIVSGGIPHRSPGETMTEDMDAPAESRMPRVSEQTALALVPKGVKASVMRLPQVHDPVKQGLVTWLVPIAREKGFSAYVGDGMNRWPAAHVKDVARLYKLAIEKQETGARYHAVAEEGVTLRDIAEALGRGLKVPVKSISPEEAGPHFGFLSLFAGLDLLTSSAITQKHLGWKPTGPGMIEDLNNMNYAQVETAASR